MYAGGKKSELSFLLMPYSYFQILWFWYHHRNIVWEQTWFGEWKGRPLPKRACGYHSWKSGRFLSCHFENTAPKPAHMGSACWPPASLSSHPLYFKGCWAQRGAQDHKSFPPFWDKPRPLCFLFVVMSLGNPRCLCPKKSRGLRWTHLSVAVRSLISVGYKKQSFERRLWSLSERKFLNLLALISVIFFPFINLAKK